MIALDLSRTGTTATTPRKDKPAGVGDAGFGVQMQKALEAGPSDRSGGANRPRTAATSPVDRAHAEDTRQRAAGDARPTGRSAARNSGMEGAGPEPGAPAPSVQASGTQDAAWAETVPAGGTTVAAPAGTVDDVNPAQNAAVEGVPAAGAVAEAAVAAAAPELFGAEGHPLVSSPAGQAAAAALSTTAAPQVPSLASAGAAGTAASAGVPGYPAGSAVTAGTTDASTATEAIAADDSGTVAATADVSLEAPSTGLPDGMRPAPAGTAGTAAGGGFPGTVAAAVPANAGGEQPNQAQSVVVPTAGAPAAPAQVSGTVMAAAPGPRAAQAAAPAYPPLAGQLSGPLFSLATAKPGAHTMTLSVTPENLGPVTVRAHIGAEGVRVELYAPNDAGREALRAILHDLRRDLASAGLGSNLDLSARNGPDGGEGGPGGQWSGDGPRQLHTTSGQAAALPVPETQAPLRFAGTPTGLDVLA